MSLSNLNSHYQYMEQSENLKRPMAIACRVCDRVFFDNVSLVLHFECHLKDDVLTPRHLSLKLSPFSCSSVERMNRVCHVSFPRMNDCPRPRPLPVSSAITPNVSARDVSLVHIPVLNSMPPMNSSFDARLNSSQPICHSTMYNRATSSSKNPLIYSQSFSCGLAPVAPLRLSERQGIFSNHENPHVKQPEIIVISDDEEDDNNNAVEIDLALKL